MRTESAAFGIAAKGPYNPLDMVRLLPLMERTSGSSHLKIGLIDGPVASHHADLADSPIRDIAGSSARVTCADVNTFACLHGTFVAGILSARRGSAAPAICPGCTLLVRPIFTTTNAAGMPAARTEELAEAILECVAEGARVLNVSAAIDRTSLRTERALQEALDHAARRGVLVVAAAGNQGSIGGTAITAHPWVIPVISVDLRGMPLNDSNLGTSLGRNGVSAPGEQITSLGVNGPTLTLSGTSAAAPFVTGAIALLWSEFPQATAIEMRAAISQASAPHRALVPPLLDAWRAFGEVKR